MTNLFKYVLSFSFVFVLIAGCMSGMSGMSDKDFKDKLAKTLKDNPDIISDAISKKPKEFFMVIQKAARQAQMEEAKKRKENEAKKLEEYYKNPLKPEIGKYESIRGNKDAPITLIMYSDFQCPFCVRGVNTVNQLREKYGEKIRYIYKHLPLVSLGHTQAPDAARYFEAIAMQDVDKAFKFHDELYKNQSRIRKGEKYFKSVAKNLKVNMKKLAKDLKSERVKIKLENDKKEATKFEFRGTPGFLLNGVPVKGAYPYEYFERVIDRLKSSGKLSL